MMDGALGQVAWGKCTGNLWCLLKIYQNIVIVSGIKTNVCNSVI